MNNTFSNWFKHQKNTMPIKDSEDLKAKEKLKRDLTDEILTAESLEKPRGFDVEITRETESFVNKLPIFNQDSITEQSIMQSALFSYFKTNQRAHSIRDMTQEFKAMIENSDYAQLRFKNIHEISDYQKVQQTTDSLNIALANIDKPHIQNKVLTTEQDNDMYNQVLREGAIEMFGKDKAQSLAKEKKSDIARAFSGQNKLFVNSEKVKDMYEQRGVKLNIDNENSEKNKSLKETLVSIIKRDSDAELKNTHQKRNSLR